MKQYNYIMLLIFFILMLSACDNNSALMKSAMSGDLDQLNAQITTGSDVNAINSYGWTALSHAARAGELRAVELLLDAGANINIQDKTGFTPLMRAVSKDHLAVVKLLVARGADLNKVDQNGWSARDVDAVYFAGQPFSTDNGLLNNLRTKDFRPGENPSIHLVPDLDLFFMPSGLYWKIQAG